MNSSRMRTVQCSGRLPGWGEGKGRMGVSTHGGVCLGGILSRGVSLRGGCLARGGGVWSGMCVSAWEVYGQGCLSREVCV